ncbi:hypothetical protein [Aquimarina mytili]|uniref:Uncharacterized protein n=1 Tax=Aquimarina mytili TaxID=874423 RepID=A0A936ZQQ8_9FLAO|nr:hypothetical protein [Aquimarina mytili]MBL0683924.1 hypothetical protein [Aquimarina mytili]
MIIQLKKRISKPSILTCIRDDQSTTWSKLHKGIETHDLAHYAVEKVMGFTNAFYGILNKGYDITDFELPKGKRPEPLQPKNLDASAIQTEHIVNLLLVEFSNSGEDSAFIDSLKSILAENNIPFPKGFDMSKLDEIRQLYSELLFAWGSLGDNEHLELSLF